MPNREPNVFVKQIAVGPMMNFAYLTGPMKGDGVILIDPSWDAKKLIGAAEEAGRRIEAILLTHGHFDHANALEDVTKRIAVPVYVHEAEAKEIPTALDIRTTREGSAIEAAGVTITCLHTPGHTPGSQCFLIGNALFTGDTLFVDGCGRVDLEGGDPEAMVRSLVRLGELPGNTIVYPGHDYGGTKVTTIEEQRQNNPYMNEQAETLM